MAQPSEVARPHRTHPRSPGSLAPAPGFLWAVGGWCLFTLFFGSLYVFNFPLVQHRGSAGASAEPRALAGASGGADEPRRPAPHTLGVHAHLRRFLGESPARAPRHPVPLGVHSAAAGDVEAKPDGGRWSPARVSDPPSPGSPTAGGCGPTHPPCTGHGPRRAPGHCTFPLRPGL